MSQRCWCLVCLGECELPRLRPITSRHRLEVNSSRYVASLSRRAWTSTAHLPPRLGVGPHWKPRALSKVMSIASWAPLKQGKSCASTSMRLSSLLDAQVHVAQVRIELHACLCLPAHTCKHPFSDALFLTRPKRVRLPSGSNRS